MGITPLIIKYHGGPGHKTNIDVTTLSDRSSPDQGSASTSKKNIIDSTSKKEASIDLQYGSVGSPVCLLRMRLCDI